jgi:hypothetical protein
VISPVSKLLYQLCHLCTRNMLCDDLWQGAVHVHFLRGCHVLGIMPITCVCMWECFDVQHDAVERGALGFAVSNTVFGTACETARKRAGTCTPLEHRDGVYALHPLGTANHNLQRLKPFMGIFQGGSRTIGLPQQGMAHSGMSF